MSKLHCPNCHKLIGNDVTDALEIDLSSNLLSLVKKTKYAPEIALEIKCRKCKSYCTCYGGDLHVIGLPVNSEEQIELSTS